jgi:hypothetical protein
MSIQGKLSRFARKSPPDQWSALKATFGSMRRHGWVTVLSDRKLRQQIFRDIYNNDRWGGDQQSKFFSGVGSRGEVLEVYVQGMAELLEHHATELGRPLTVIDLGCGDFEVGRALVTRLPDLTYIGCDIVPELIAHNVRTYASEKVSFRQLDIVSDPLPEGDVCLVRQVLQHLSNVEIAAFLQRINYGYLYVTEGHPAVRTGPFNPDIGSGVGVRFDWSVGRGRGVELGKPPYLIKTREMFRASAHPNEIIITEQVLRPPPATD